MKDEVVLALDSLAVLMLPGCFLDLDYCYMNIPSTPCVGLPQREPILKEQQGQRVGYVAAFFRASWDSVIHPVYKQHATLESELYMEWKPLVQILAQDYAHCVTWLGSTLAKLATHLVISS